MVSSSISSASDDDYDEPLNDLFPKKPSVFPCMAQNVPQNT